jgi:hypothetical protein
MTQTVRDRPFTLKRRGLGFLFGDRIFFFLLFLCDSTDYYFLNVTLFYIVKILSQIIFFLYPSQPEYFFLKIQHQIIVLAKNHAPPSPFKVCARVCVSVIWEKREGLAKTVMGLFLYLSLKLKIQPIQLWDRPFNLKGEGGAWFFAKTII